MILGKLKEYADNQMKLPPEMYGETRVRWLIDLNPDGTLESFTPLGGDTKANKRGEIFVLPHILRSSGIKPKLLADNGEYVLGIARPDSKHERVIESHRQFITLIKKCAEITQEPTVQAVAKFLESWHPKSAKLPSNFDPSDNITFRVNSIIPAVQLPSVQRFWADYTAGNESEETTEERPIMTCLVTGKIGPVEERLPVKIKGIPNGQPTGTALVSANAPPFTSYGLKNSLTSPISRDAAERFAKALNHLIATKNSRMYVGPIVYVFWTRELTNFDSFEFLDSPKPQAVKNLLKSVYTAQQVHTLSANQFYALALSASGGRAVVRDWVETTILDVQENLKNWFKAQEIVDVYSEEPDKIGEPLSVYKLAASAYRDASKEMTPAVVTTLVRVALNGGRLPDELLVRVVHRNRVERKVTPERAAFTKLILTTQGVPMTDMEALNPNPELEDRQDRAAYHCGRLLAELEAIQRAAIGNINTSLTDRYYGSASSTPANVFGTLHRGAIAHLGKLRKSSPGLCSIFEERMEEITSHLPKFPPTLTMQQQSLFALGYYHQRAKDRAAIKASKTSKN